jgi:hypothetical protein
MSQLPQTKISMRYKPQKNSELLEELSLIGQIPKEHKISKQS